VRIISGLWKGKAISVPQEGTRPSTDRTRQALFSILLNVVENARVLDLYSGSGALALECLSRGSATATAVDADKHACRVITQNARTLQANKLQVIQSETLPFLDKHVGSYTLLFADPPYERSFIGSELQLTLSHERLPQIMDDEAIFIAESPSKLNEEELAILPDYWSVLSRRKYGKSHITIFQYSA